MVYKCFSIQSVLKLSRSLKPCRSQSSISFNDAKSPAGNPIQIQKALPINLSLTTEDSENSVNVTSILDFLMIGGEEITCDKNAMQSLGITHIVNCTKHCQNRFSKQNGCLDGFEYIKLSLSDRNEEIISEKFLPSFNMIEDARKSGGRCLVHCSQGMSRSAAIVVGYLVKYMNMSLIDALRLAKEKRSQISPNIGFMYQLILLELATQKKNSIDLSKYVEDRFGDVSSWSVEDGFRQTLSLSEVLEGLSYVAPPASTRERCRSHPQQFF